MIETIEAYGLKFRVPAGDTHVGGSLRNHGEFARPELEFMLDHTRGKTGTILDVGANIGAFALPLAKARPQWTVIAYEASPPIGQLLVDSAALNGLENLRVLHAAAGRTAGTAEFPAVDIDQGGNLGRFGFRADEDMGRTQVPMVTLDESAPEGVGLVKIDVQGYEAEVLKGASRLIQQDRPVWLVEADAQWPENLAMAYETFAAAGYRLFWFYSVFATPLARGRVEHPLIGDASMIALPPGVDNRWGLMTVAGPQDRRPGYSDAYPYLRRYGFQ